MIIIKIGGGKKINLDYIVEDLKNIKDSFIIVHGGNYVLDEYLKKTGIEKKILKSPDGQVSRFTNQEIIDSMFMTYAGYMNKTIVMKCQKAGINAIGFSGVDGRLITGLRHDAVVTIDKGKKKIIRDDLTGVVESVNTRLLLDLLDRSLIPVISPPVITDDNLAINVDGDKIALKIASALNASELIFLIEAPGMLKNADDETSLLKTIKKNEIDKFLTNAKGRMKKKLLSCKWALNQGIKQVHIADGRVKNPVTYTLYKKKGTIIQ